MRTSSGESPKCCRSPSKRLRDSICLYGHPLMSICLQYFLRVVTPMSSLAAAFEMGKWTTAATSVIDNDRALQIAVFSRRYKCTHESGPHRPYDRSLVCLLLAAHHVMTTAGGGLLSGCTHLGDKDRRTFKPLDAMKGPDSKSLSVCVVAGKTELT